jgi:hypothetical protein
MAIMLLMVLLFYKLKWTFTHDLWKNYRQTMALVEQSSTAAMRLEELKKQGEDVVVTSDSLLSKQDLQAELFDLLNKVVSKYDVNVISISNPVIQQTQHFEVTGFEVELLGGFHGIVQSTDALESNTIDMKLVSMSFKKSLNRALKKDQLKAKLYIQHFKAVNL